MSTDSPILSVIDDAIRRVEIRTNTYCCLALIDACQKYGVDSNEYLRQFERFVRRSQYRRKRPEWWNQSFNRWRQTARIAALRGFRQACIDAAQ